MSKQLVREKNLIDLRNTFSRPVITDAVDTGDKVIIDALTIDSTSQMRIKAQKLQAMADAANASVRLSELGISSDFLKTPGQTHDTGVVTIDTVKQKSAKGKVIAAVITTVVITLAVAAGVGYVLFRFVF